MRSPAMKDRKRKGFTLVELLIVIIIIGILAGSMMLVAGSGTDKAEATKIVSDLRSLKTAALMYYADHNTWASGDVQAKLGTYMDRDLSKSKHKFALNNNGNGVGVTNLTANSGVNEKLAAMAKEVGLYNTALSSDFTLDMTQIWMRVR